MAKEYEIRKEKALEINSKIGNLAEGLMIVGSVAYNSDAVTEKSDLDLVGVFDFSSLKCKEIYNNLEKEHEPILLHYLSGDRFNVFSIVWDEQFEIGLHIWDRSAFNNAISLRHSNSIFIRKDWINYPKRVFLSSLVNEEIKDLRGKSKVFERRYLDVPGGRIMQFNAAYESKSNFYPSIQTNNLLMNPEILSQKGNYISKGITEFNQNLKNTLLRIYGANHDKNISLYNALPQKIKDKVPDDLKKKLDNYF